jgi:hypothetical protein
MIVMGKDTKTRPKNEITITILNQKTLYALQDYAKEKGLDTISDALSMALSSEKEMKRLLVLRRREMQA